MFFNWAVTHKQRLFISLQQNYHMDKSRSAAYFANSFVHPTTWPLSWWWRFCWFDKKESLETIIFYWKTLNRLLTIVDHVFYRSRICQILTIFAIESFLIKWGRYLSALTYYSVVIIDMFNSSYYLYWNISRILFFYILQLLTKINWRDLISVSFTHGIFPPKM